MEQLLTKLKTIKPNEEFKTRSRALILSSPQTSFHPKIFRRFLTTFQFSAAFSLAAAFIFLIIGGLTMLNQKLLSPAALSSLDPEKINEESEKLDIQIQLSQAKYYENSAKKIDVALNETSDELKKTINRQKELEQLLNELTL